MGMNKVGVAVSLDQAKAIHLNAKGSDQSPNLNMEEFGRLLFSHDETLNVDLTKHMRTEPD